MTPASPAIVPARRQRLLLALVALAVAVSVYAGHSLLFGRGLGEECRTAAECSWTFLRNRACHQGTDGYCTRHCTRDGECPPTWRCSNRICFKP